jgi:hypothetical protein
MYVSYKKITNDKKLLVMRFHYWPTKFRPLSSDFYESGRNLAQIAKFRQQSDFDMFCHNLGCRILATIAGIQPVPLDSDNRIPKFGDLWR